MSKVFQWRCLTALMLIVSAYSAHAQFLRPKAPNCPPVNPPSSQFCPPGGTTAPVYPYADPSQPYDPAAPRLPDPFQPSTNPTDPAQNPLTQPQTNGNTFAQANEGGGTNSSSFNESFNGDFGGIVFRRRVTAVDAIEIGSGSGDFVQRQRQDQLSVLASRYSSILLSDNDSPRPVNRVYYGFNHFNNVLPTQNNGYGRATIERHMIGFEKTILDGRGSFGIRLPFFSTSIGAKAVTQQVDPFTNERIIRDVAVRESLNNQNVGDLTILTKYAFYLNPQTNDVGSAGLIITTTTGNAVNDISLADGSQSPNSVLLQPWVGGIRNFQSGYFQGYSSVVVPLDSRDVTLLNNSLSLGYYLYQNRNDRIMQAIIPNVELHVRTPLSNRDPNGLIYVQDQVNLTSGVHFRTQRATVSPAFSVPLAGPRPFDSEFALWVNFRF